MNRYRIDSYRTPSGSYRLRRRRLTIVLALAAALLLFLLVPLIGSAVLHRRLPSGAALGFCTARGCEDRQAVPPAVARALADAAPALRDAADQAELSRG